MTEDEVVQGFAEQIAQSARKLAPLARAVSLEVDDLQQVGAAATVVAWRHYEPGRGPFENFANQRIRFAMLDAINAARFGPQHITTVDYPMAPRLFPPRSELSALANSPASSEIPPEAVERMVDAIRNASTERAWQEWVMNRIDGLSYEEIARRQSVSHQAVSYRVRRNEVKFDKWAEDMLECNYE